MIESLLFLLFLGGSAAGIASASDENDKPKKKEPDYDDYLARLGKTHSWTNYWEDPITGDYRKHRIDIEID